MAVFNTEKFKKDPIAQLYQVQLKLIDFGTANDDEFIKTIFPEQENQQDNSTYPIFRVSLLEKFKVFF